MPNVDDQLEALLRDAAPRPTTSGLDERLARRRRTRALRRRVGRTALVIAVFAGTAAGFVTLTRAFDEGGTQPADTSASPTPPAPADLGLGFPICRVSSMPIETTAGSGIAYVFTKVTDGGCPTQRQGDVGVGVDVDGDGRIDATAGPLTDCFFVCDLFATPDINGDGTDEVMTSSAGADGYGITAFAITGERVDELVSLDPIVVEGEGVGFVRPGPMTFGWVGAAAHRELAYCSTTDQGTPSFVIESADVGERSTSIADTTLSLSGAAATVIGTDARTVPVDETPDPGTTLCGQPVRVSDNPIPPSGTAGLTADRLIGAPLGTDLSDASIGCVGPCVLFSMADLNTDGVDEILVYEGRLGGPVSGTVRVFEIADGALVPVPFQDFPDGFPLLDSSSAPRGAYCTPSGVFTLWLATEPGAMYVTPYRLDSQTLRFVRSGRTRWEPYRIPDETGYDGSLCGDATAPLS